MTQSRNPKATGERSEGIVLGELMKLGKVVLFPFGNNQRYDLVIDEGDGRFVRVQVKTAWWENGCVCFKPCNVNAFTGKRTTYVGGADEFMVYSPHVDKVYRVPVNQCGTSEVRLRVDQPRSGQRADIRWASDYELRTAEPPAALARPRHSRVAQLAERSAVNREVTGSEPVTGAVVA
jgi:PD-(D/E)XK endonuclease